MKFTEFASYIRFHTRTNSTTLSDSDILLLANIHKDKLTMAILNANENYFGLPQLTNLVADQREYPIDITVAHQFKLIEAKLDGTNWKRLTETDLNLEQFTTDETGIRNAFLGRDPGFQIFRNSLWILNDSAIINVTNGLKIWAYIWPASFTDLTSTTEMATAPSTTTHGWPRPFQELLARRVIIDYKTSRDKPMTLTESEKNYKMDLMEALDDIKNPNLDRSILATIPVDSGEDY